MAEAEHRALGHSAGMTALRRQPLGRPTAGWLQRNRRERARPLLSLSCQQDRQPPLSRSTDSTTSTTSQRKAHVYSES